nr:YqgE/AlgH family protein [Martelella mediterranea]
MNFESGANGSLEIDVLENFAKGRERGPFDGQFLIAMPQLAESEFERSVIYICAHSGDGAMGFIINRAQSVTFPEVLHQLDLVGEERDPEMPSLIDFPVLCGGPVEPGRGFVLHSYDYSGDGSIPISDDMAMTGTLDVLKSVAAGRGPERATLLLGYTGWAPGQLESEIANNDWLTCPAIEDMVFDRDLDSKYERALYSMGVRPSSLSTNIGHA